MLFDADAVPDPVDEVLAVSGSGDDPTTDRVDLLARLARSDGVSRRRLGVLEDVVELDEARPGRARHDRPRRVGAVADVAVKAKRPAEVADDRLSGADDPWTGFVMRARRIRAGCHDREVDAIVALGDEPTSDL